MKGIDVIVEQAGSRYQIAVVRVLGQIDTTTSHELERRLQFLLKDLQFEIVIDLSKVSYISSAGWGIFISEIRGIRESGGDLKLTGMTPEVGEVFELLEFHNILESFRTVHGAVESFEKARSMAEGHQDSEGSAVSETGQERGTSEPPLDASEESVAVEGGAQAPEKEAAVDGSSSEGSIAAASGTAWPERTSSDPSLSDVPAAGRSGSPQSTTPGPSVATGVMESLKGAAQESVNETELEIVDPLHPDVKQQIKAEVVEEPETAAWQDPERPAEPAGEELIGERSSAPRAQEPEADLTQARESDAPEDGAVEHEVQAETQEPPAAESVSREFQQMILETVKEHPEFGCLKIRGELLRRGYRKTINPLSLFMELKRLNLETKDKRRHYAESLSTADGDV
jgi:anti-sigma B factor antagonist